MRVHSGGMLIGLIAGLLIGCVLVGIMLKVTKTDGDMKCKYDERQNNARGIGFKYAFFTGLIGNVLFAFFYSCFSGVIMKAEVGMILVALLSLLVYVSYCIWNDAYFSLNENRKKVMIVFVVVGVINLVLGIGTFHSGAVFTDGMLNIRSTNLFCGLMFLIIFAELFLKKYIQGNTEDDE